MTELRNLYIYAVDRGVKMKIITIAQTKGGVGKTTLAVNLACAAHLDNYQVQIIELDRQGTASNWYERRKKQPPEVIYVNGPKLAQSLRNARSSGIDLVIIDLPGTHNPSTVWGIREADYVLIPSRCNIADLEASEVTIATIAEEEKPSAFVLTFVAKSAAVAKKTRKELEDIELTVAPATIRQHKIFPTADEEGVGVLEKYKEQAGAQDVLELWKWIKEEINL